MSQSANLSYEVKTGDGGHKYEDLVCDHCNCNGYSRDGTDRTVLSIQCKATHSDLRLCLPCIKDLFEDTIKYDKEYPARPPLWKRI